MDRDYKILGQAAPADTNNVTLYTVPTGPTAKYAVISLLNVLNRDQTVGAEPATFRVAIVPNGETLANKHWIDYDTLLELRGTKTRLQGMSLAAGTSVIVQAGTVNLSFTLSGVEATAS